MNFSIIFVQKSKINHVIEMKILITNDDCYTAKGIGVLYDILKPYGDITSVAPKKPQSGMSMAVSMGLKPIGVKKIGQTSGLGSWYLDGTPASCIKYGIDNIFHPQTPDLIVSGINHGSNAATASLYSGTIGAAMEAAVNGIPGIGVSLDCYSPDADFSAVKEWLPSILDKLLPILKYCSQGAFYNINFPNLPSEKISGVKICHMGKAHWEREYRPYFEYLHEIGATACSKDIEYVREAEQNGETVYVMAGDFTDNGDNKYPSDHLLLSEGYITITPQNIDNTDYEEIQRLCGII
ncbi:MAG TPA: 5'/3'-nucleotidase SurE [Rikenellaceae bacterium]|nr:5'/3'-nucleotidase SurE [Rikenellaceae bacterium]HBH20902.1 5'/3'-nucleotidase SurE [Rikenellaceae bacterium]